MKELKTDKFGWLNYKGNILILSVDNRIGKRIHFQYDGTSCLHADLKCKLIESFKSNSKWFNEDWWYKKTVWGDNYPSMVYFDETEYNFDDDNDKSFLKQFSSLESIKKAERRRNEKGNKGAISSKQILEEILEEVNKNTKTKYFIDFENTDYGENWYEAFIPIKNKNNKKFILTWMNCD